MSIIKSLFDKIIFATGVLLFMQVPHFIDQYEQRLGGYYQAQVKHLEQYQAIADKQHKGDLRALINDFESSANASVQHTGNNIRQIEQESQQLKQEVQGLTNQSFVVKVITITKSLKMDIARAVIDTFKPAFPLSIEGFVCGLLGGLFMSALFNGVVSMPRVLFANKKHQTKQRVSTGTKQRVEPTIMRPARAG